MKNTKYEYAETLMNKGTQQNAFYDHKEKNNIAACKPKCCKLIFAALNLKKIFFAFALARCEK